MDLMGDIKYIIRFKYIGEDDVIQRDFNIDSMGKEYKFDNSDDFLKNISLMSNIDIKLGSNEYKSSGGIYEICDDDVLLFHVCLNTEPPIDYKSLFYTKYYG